MSSAILYLAIIAIWLCVLIPRWLKRDSARGAVAATDTAVAAESPATARADADADADAHEAVLADDGAPQAAEPGVTARPTAAPAAPLSAEETRRRILTGRRRLLGMLIVLEIAAIALAVVGLAAMWVIIPPTIMLTGYLLLLREAAHADAERAQHEAEAAAHARERERARAKAARARAGPSAPPRPRAPPSTQRRPRPPSPPSSPPPRSRPTTRTRAGTSRPAWRASTPPRTPTPTRPPRTTSTRSRACARSATS